MIDCVIVGFNQSNFQQYVELVRSMGSDKGAYRDLNLAFVTHHGRHYGVMDLLNKFQAEAGDGARPYSNADFLWPVVTYLHTYLKRRGFSVDFINLFQEEKADFVDMLSRGDVRTVAITTTLYVSVEPILEIIELVRSVSPSTTIILGGPFVQNQATMMDPLVLESFFDSVGADIYVISPEGEAALAGILGAMKAGTSLSGVSNIAYRDGSEFVLTPKVTESNALEENPVDYTLFGADRFNGFVNLRTAKSCPFACAFCSFPGRAGKYSYLSVDLVERELNAIRDLSTVTTLTFLDDTFNVPKGRFKDIMRMMIRNNYGFRWNCFVRADHADSEAVELMQRSGCEGVFLGVESGSDRILAEMNKTSRRADYMRIIPELRAAGILSYTSLIVGFPGETLESVQESMDLVETARPDYFRAQLWYCDPTTPVWSRRKELQVKGSAFSWSHPTMDAATACELVERFFLNIRNATWLPQFGFELWSLFYLQRRGMTRAAVKDLVTAFNGAVRAKLVDRTHAEIDDASIATIQHAVRLGQAVDERVSMSG